MSDASWGALWDHFLRVLALEPMEMRIAFWLAVALLTVMALEGVRANVAPLFRPATKSVVHPKPDVASGFSANPPSISAARGHALTKIAINRAAPRKRETVKKLAKPQLVQVAPRRFRSIRRA